MQVLAGVGVGPALRAAPCARRRPAVQVAHLHRGRTDLLSVRSDGESPSLASRKGRNLRNARLSASAADSGASPDNTAPLEVPVVVEPASTAADVIVPAESKVAEAEPAAPSSASIEAATQTLPSDPEQPAQEEAAPTQALEELKLQLLAAVSSLDRGIAANVREAKEVDELASALEAAGGSVVLQWKTSEACPDESTMEQLAGTWRLIYSSGFNTGSLGGRRPGPPAALFPVVLGQVYQRIDNNQGKLDNIVEFLFSYPLPPLPFISSEPQSPAVRLTLGHDFKVLNINTVEITYEDTAAQFQGTELLDSFPRLAAPSLPESLRPPRFLRTATFDVTYLDATMRVTRGDRGELRIYLRDSDLADAPPTAAPTEPDDLD